MSLSEAQQAAVDYAQAHMGRTTVPTDWVKTSERTFNGPFGDDYEHFTLTHADGTELHAVAHEEDLGSYGVIEGGTLLYDLCEDPSMASAGFAGVGAIFCPKSFWQRNHYLFGTGEHEHQATLLMAAFSLPRALAENEVEEGQFAMPGHIKTIADAHDYLQKQGYEYTDMTSAVTGVPSAGSSTTRKSGISSPAAEVIQVIVDDLKAGTAGPAGEIYLGQLLADKFGEYEYAETLEEVTLALLEKSGIQSPMDSVFAGTDRDELLKRAEKALMRQAAMMPASKAQPAIAQAKEWAALPPADLTGKDMAEVYRLAIRGKVPQIAAIAFCWDEERKGGANEDEIGWYCGYADHDGRLIRDLHIPDHVFEGWFPELKKITWNDYEPKDRSNYHTMPEPDEAYIEGTRALIASRYLDKGAVQLDDLIAPPLAPIVPLSTRAPTRPAGYVPSYSGTGESRIETLRAYPPGHTGKATPVAAPVVAVPVAAPTSPVSAPASVSTMSGSDSLWREYQLDITALKSRGIERAGYQVVDTTPSVVFALGFLDEHDGVVEVIPQEEVIKLFSEYRVECLDDGITYKVNKLFGQSLEDLEKAVRDRLQGVNIFDAAS